MRSATKQSRRPWLPSITGPVSTHQLAERLRSAALAVVLHEAADEPLPRLLGEALPIDGEVIVVVGPEGGITPDELNALLSAGAHVCRLGDTVLRAATAGVAGLSVVLAATRWA